MTTWWVNWKAYLKDAESNGGQRPMVGEFVNEEYVNAPIVDLLHRLKRTNELNLMA